MADLLDPPGALPPRIVHHRLPGWMIWIVPLVAVLIGLSLLINAWRSAGPQITISFASAAGLEPGKTPVKFKDVVIGNLTAVKLTGDYARVIASVDLDRSVAGIARSDTRFWVVRPRIGAGGVSGIDTLISGAYIAVDAGKSEEPRKAFTGLESPPTVINGTPGKTFMLHSEDLGSLDIGAPVYYKRIQVGRVASYQLDPDGRGVAVQVFVDAPHDRLVTRNSRFWNASGIDLRVTADGLKVNTQSLATVVAGGVAFANLAGSVTTPAPDQTRFELVRDQQTAMAVPDGPPHIIRMRFDQAMRGLAANAPVEFMGINVGQVESINLDYDKASERFSLVVDAAIYPSRLGPALSALPATAVDSEDRQSALFVKRMVDRGLRAQARNGNLLTGQLYVALDFVPKAPKVAFDVTARPLIMPTVPGTMDKLQEQIGAIVAKVEKIPFDSIGQKLDQNLNVLSETMGQINRSVLPGLRDTLAEGKNTLGTVNQALGVDGPLQQNLNHSLIEVQRSARSLRDLTDFLNRRPDALLRGRPSGGTAPNVNGEATQSPLPREKN